MPLPIVHSFAGYSIYRSSSKARESGGWKWAALAILLANLADFDYLPGAFVGQMGRFHRGISHSLGAAVFVGLFTGLLARVWKKDSFKESALFSFSAYVSHIFLDFFSMADSYMLLFWPLSSVRFNPPFCFDIAREESLKLAGGMGEFLSSMLSPGFLGATLSEAALVLFIWAGARLVSELRFRKIDFPARAKEQTVSIGEDVMAA